MAGHVNSSCSRDKRSREITNANFFSILLVLQFNFVDTWSDPHYLGLTGLTILGTEGQPLDLSTDMLQANPRDLNDLPEYEDDDRTIDK